MTAPRARRAAATLVCALVAGLALPALPGGGGVALAQELTTAVPANWSLAPAGLSAGDRFRLLFTAYRTGNCTSSDLATYDSKVQGVAAAGHADIQSHSTLFKVIGSTATVDARDHTGTTGTGVPVYWLNGAKVADDNADFYDGTWDSYDARLATGAIDMGAVFSKWTGSNDAGTGLARDERRRRARRLRAARPRRGFRTLLSEATHAGSQSMGGPAGRLDTHGLDSRSRNSRLPRAKRLRCQLLAARSTACEPVGDRHGGHDGGGHARGRRLLCGGARRVVRIPGEPRRQVAAAVEATGRSVSGDAPCRG